MPRTASRQRAARLQLHGDRAWPAVGDALDLVPRDAPGGADAEALLVDAEALEVEDRQSEDVHDDGDQEPAGEVEVDQVEDPQPGRQNQQPDHLAPAELADDVRLWAHSTTARKAAAASPTAMRTPPSATITPLTTADEPPAGSDALVGSAGS